MAADKHPSTISATTSTRIRAVDKAVCALIDIHTQECRNIAQQIASAITSQANEANNTLQVIVALATLQSSVQELSRAYINHANTVLAPGKVGAIDPGLSEILTTTGLLTGGQAVPALIAAETEEGGKKKRKRAPHDPNAPKRALTPYFLYMQHARAQIHKELGDQARPKEVADEGTRRWGIMTPAEKSVWDDKYQMNLAAYRVRMAAYKAGEPVPDDDEALRMVESGKVPTHVVAAAEESEEEPVAPAPVVEEDSSEESSPEPEREPSPPKSKRRKSDKKAEDTPKETPKAKAKGTKAKKEASPVPVKAAAADKRKKGRK